jgi:hypothetical protein
MIGQIIPVIDHSVRGLCCRPYPGHPRGCPNYGKKPGCPPGADLFDQAYNLDLPVHAIWNAFGEHVIRMKKLHPEWSERQLYCCLYWQGKARWELAGLVVEALVGQKRLVDQGYVPIHCPEAMGVNVSLTMERIGVKLEWPPRIIAYQVALAGVRREDQSDAGS